MLAHKVLKGFHYPGLGPNPFDLAASLGYHVSIEDVEKSYSLRLPDGLWLIVLKTSSWPERRAFSCAHEIIHIECQRRGLTLSEREVERAASLLLMPDPGFRWACHTTNFDLFALKRLYPVVSHQAIAYRIADVLLCQVKVVDNGIVKPIGVQLDSLEESLVTQAERSNQPVETQRDSLTFRAYPIFNGDFRHVILLNLKLPHRRLSQKPR